MERKIFEKRIILFCILILLRLILLVKFIIINILFLILFFFIFLLLLVFLNGIGYHIFSAKEPWVVLLAKI